MNKEYLENVIQEHLEKNQGRKSLRELVDCLIQFAETNLNAETDAWLFQSQGINEIDELEDSKEAVFNFIFANLEAYFNFYINIERVDIEPSGVADVWVSFTVSNKSKELIIETLNKIKDNLSDLSELSDVRDIIDIRLPYYSDGFIDNIEITSSKVIMTK